MAVEEKAEIDKVIGVQPTGAWMSEFIFMAIHLTVSWVSLWITNVNLVVILHEIHQVGTMVVCTKYHRNPSNSYFS